MYLFLASTYRWIAFIPPLVPLYTINNISTLVVRSNFTVTFLRPRAIPIPVQKENEHDQAHIFQGTYSKSY